MITNFEEITQELNKDELAILHLVIQGFKGYTKDNPIKADLIISRMNEFLSNKNYKIKINGPRLRKFVNHIRTNSLLPLMATSKGYFVTDDKDIILAQITSLMQRANSIEGCAQGLKEFL
jgi:hypothetical protein